MNQNEKTCTEIVGEIISKYSNIKTGETSTRFEVRNETATVLESEKEFWDWFCSNVNDKHFMECFLESDREDYYGSLEEIRAKYKERCKK